MATKFKVRARTVDMLGRQQIAGIPTAISELFKNAHDAYARNVDVDYFRDDGLFVLRDDGLGMTRDDFEQRWLTLGTESKIGSARLDRPQVDPKQPVRPILGEKGIGRLAIATIGPQVLVLSRAGTKENPGDMTIAAYLQWQMFELPGLDLDDIAIPLREFPGGHLPGSGDVSDMVAEAKGTLDRLASRADLKRAADIRESMETFDADPLEYSKFLGEPALTGNGCGTHFYILPADRIIDDDIDTRQAENKATRFERNLIGFTNTMTPDHPRPALIARFRDHKDEGKAAELIGEKAFFTQDEFTKVDHHFLGRFDEFGQFQGKVGIYQMEPEDYVLNWRESDGMRTLCGPFSLSFAYMQGIARDSLVPPQEHTRLRKKLDRYGGLYIYRDGIRVQPYGDSDYDWLDIERNRTLGAGYYFYSYRRMFGVIELDQKLNGNLTEKAGREGFRENQAYRQFRSILMNFFLQTAGDFFREDGKYAEPHAEKKDELNRNAEIRLKKSRQARQKRAAFQENLQKAFDLIDEQKPELKAEELLTLLKREVQRVQRQNVPKKQKAQALMRLEKETRDQMLDFRKGLVVAKPRGVGLSRALANEWNSYLAEFKRLDAEVFGCLDENIESCVSEAAGQAKIPFDAFVRLHSAVSRSGKEAEQSVRRLRRDIEVHTQEIATEIKERIRKSITAVRQIVDLVDAEIERLQRSDGGGVEEMTNARAELVGRINSVHDAERAKLERVRDQLALVSSAWEEGGYDTAELTEALEEELEELKARRDADLELTQIGMALNTISHEFDKTVGALRDGLRRLEGWADANPDLVNLYDDIRISFDHLDEYLTLFTSLDSRLDHKRVTISGKQIRDFLGKLFQARLNRHDIALSATRDFLDTKIFCYPSSIYPPFVNLVDNSIFWLQGNRDQGRQIVLDADGNDLLVHDNGPGISSRDRDNVFEVNFSRKPGGRGMGLHISRETLQREGMQLSLESVRQSDGTTFRISTAGQRHNSQEIGQ